MNQNSENLRKPEGQAGDPLIVASETLRLLANVPPPEGLTDRIHARVHRRLLAQQSALPARSFWFGWQPAMRAQFAAAVVVLVATAAGSWNLYRIHSANSATPASQANHAPSVPVAPAPVPMAASGGGFSTAGAVRMPPTLTPLHVPPAPRKKSGAKHVAKKASPKAAVVAPASQPDSTKP